MKKVLFENINKFFKCVQEIRKHLNRCIKTDFKEQ